MQKIARWTAFAGALLIVAGLFWSRAMMSIGCAVIFLHPIVNGNIRSTLWACRRGQAWLPGLYYLLIVLSFFWTDNTHAWWDQNVLLKMTMVLLPFGLLSPNAMDRKRVIWLLYAAIGAAWLTGVLSFGNYILHYNAINESIIHSKPIPIITAIGSGREEAYHIYYSLMLGFAALAGLWMLRQPQRRWVKGLLFFFTFTNILFLHVIAARTGLVAFYAALVVGLVYFIIVKKKVWLGLAGLVILLTAGVMTVTLIPSMKARFENTLTDVTRYRNGQDINDYSISMRIEALRNGWKVFTHSPVIGVAPGDVTWETKAQYKRDHSYLTETNRHLPHNQFVESLAMLGIMGGILLLLFFVFPGSYRGVEFRLLFILFMALCFVAFQFESVLERQVGLSFFMLFYCLLGLRRDISQR